MLDLPDYIATQKVYEGEETAVYRGHRASDGAPVAIKLTRSDYPTARALGRLRREFGILQDIGHIPGVARAYALEKAGRGLALVMEDLGETSLHQALRSGRLDVGTALGVAIAVADILDALHRRSVIHKDIKPHNIMLGASTDRAADRVGSASAREPRLIDFGISARLSQETTSAAALEGTIAYMSPEQTGRMNRPLDRRTDLYSLGATIYEALTGVVPFSSADPAEIIHGHIARTAAPPHERAPFVPRGLSDVVMKLLAKNPEDRYQTARGLKADLEACLSRWQESGTIDPFPLAQKDIADELTLPQRLHGRDIEVQILLDAFERARRGGVEILLVSGYAGVGKSALVSEIHKPIAEGGGYFVRGKFDQVNRGVPLAPIAHAFRELIRQILAEPPGALEAWKVKLREAVGVSGRVLCDLVPELEILLGPQPETPSVGPAEAKNRFGILVQRFLRVFATKDHPLCLFLDDLQWADPASRDLLSVLLGDPEGKHLLVVGAYRDHEVDESHPIRATIEEIGKRTPITTLTLAPLDLRTTAGFIAEALGARADDVAALAAIVFDKTRGNPFFVGQFLGALHEEGLIRWDAEASAFTWDEARIRAAMVTDNVVELMVNKLGRLSPAARRALVLAACIGHEFDLRALGAVAEEAPAAAAAALWEALREGLVVPLDGDYRLLDESAGAREADADFQVSYRFLHDRVREAAYSLIEKESREAAHLRVGRLLLARSGKDARDEDLLEIVRHLNEGRAQITDPAEREAIAALDLRAGRRAKASTAYEAAAGYFEAGAALLREEGWDRAYDLSFALHVEGAECAYLSGQTETADARFDAILPRAKTALERARVHNLRMVLCATRGRFADTVREGLAGLALLGVTIPEAPADRQAAFGAALAKVTENLRGRPIEDLIDAPELTDPASQAALSLLCDLTLPIFYVSPDAFGLIVLEMVNTSLEHGHSSISAFGYMSFGFLLAAVLGQPAAGHAYGSLALALNEKLPSTALHAKLCLTFAGYFYLREPARDLVPLYDRGCKAAMEAGDFFYLASTSYYGVTIRFALGHQLDDVAEALARASSIAQRTRDVTATGVVTIIRQALANLTGRTRTRSTLSDDAFDEDAFLDGLSEKEHGIALALFHLFKLTIQYLHGDHAAAVASAEAAERYSPNIFGLYYATRIHLYAALALLAIPPSDAAEEEDRRRAAVARHKDRIAGLAAISPANFQHKLVLIEAEEARRKGDLAAAVDLFDRAIALASENGFPHDEALGNELGARTLLAMGKPKLARPYMTDAHLGYVHWGATAKADDLARDHGDLLPRVDARARQSTTTSASVNTSGTTLLGATIGSIREAALVVRAAQGIAGEIELSRVIERLVKIVLENAGAQRGALLISRGDQLFVEATFGLGPDQIAVGPSAPLDARDDLARSVALFVARTREAVIVDDAREDRRFLGDPYLAARRARSILCLPLVHQGRLSGLLYLEHKDAPAAFTTARVELLELFASQAAISVENAILVADVREANEHVRRANERLEAEVAERTEELVTKNRELGDANERLHVELTQREEAQRERAMLHERMIEAQRSRLVEMSTPLIPITDRIVVMPLIGTVDAERAAQVIEVALEGAQRHRASVVILDITGMKHIDTQVVSSLLRTASALRLLGAQAVLTGTRPEVAQAMVALGADLSGIVTKGTLQSGIAYALERSGEASLLAGDPRRTSGRQ